MVEFRIGCGYDAHAFTSGRPLVLGGVEIDSVRGLSGSSDADVLTHAVIDALLGAAGLGDLGDWFPPDDPRFVDARSVVLLEQVVAALRGRGWRPVNVDATVIAQEPRLAGTRGRIRDGLAARLELELSRVSVKATTPDHLGAIGRGEGIAAQAVVLIESRGNQHGADSA